MNTPTGVPTPIEERHEVLEALKAGEMTPLISLGSVDKAMTYLKSATSSSDGSVHQVPWRSTLGP